MPEQQALTERVPLAEAAGGQTPKGRRFRARIIQGDIQGSSGFYPAEMLKRDADVFREGLAVFLDHPGVTEAYDRPERSVRDLAGRLATAATYERDGLYADVEVYEHWAPVIEAMAGDIGMSIRASGTVEASTQDNIRGPIVTSLTDAASVDFVTAAGAGGKIVALLESARAQSEAKAPPFTKKDSKADNAAGKADAEDAADGGKDEDSENADGTKKGKLPAFLKGKKKSAVAESRNIGGWIESRLHLALTQLGDDMYGQGRLSRDERITLSGAVGDALTAFAARVEADQPQLYQRDLYDEPDDAASGAAMSEATRALAKAADMTANDLRDALCGAVKDTYGGKDIYVWVRDWTDTWVVFSLETDSESALYQQTYTVADKSVTLTGDTVEVVARTTYEPEPQAAGEKPEDKPGADSASQTGEAANTNAPGRAPATQKEGAMPEINEEQARQLAEAASTKTALEEAVAKLNDATSQIGQLRERADAADARADASDAEKQALRNDKAARALMAEALKTSGLPEASHANVTESACRDLPLTDAGTLDAVKLGEAIAAAIAGKTTEIASVLESAGVGQIRGLGESRHETSIADIDKELEEAFAGLPGMNAEAAKVAVNGRA